MLCDICHENEATIEIKKSDSLGKTFYVRLCPSCAASSGISPENKDLASSIVRLVKKISVKKTEEDNKCCPVCGQKLSVLKTSFRAGCPECYAIFGDEIRAIMKSQGVNASYTGSLPNRLSSFKSSLTDRLAIQAKLLKAVECEEYEKAAIYRDYLRSLEKKAVFEADSETDSVEENEL